MKRKYFIVILFLIYGSSTHAQNTQLWGMTSGFVNSAWVNYLGTIFKINLDSTGFQTVYTFDSLSGYNPYGNLLHANDGKLYGLTNRGGTYNVGVIFRYDIVSLTYSNLNSFTGANGHYPVGSLIQGNDNKLYGMTYYGGTYNRGLIFGFDLTNDSCSDLHDFNWTDGSYPTNGMIKGSDGKLYGTTDLGGTTSVQGVIFSFEPVTNVYSVLFDDFNATNGGGPVGSLVEANDGKLYGITEGGGTYNGGVLFSYSPISDVYTKLYDFSILQGAFPRGGLIQASDNKLYGVTIRGGADTTHYNGDPYSGAGVIFSYDISNNIYTNEFDFDGMNGKYPGAILMQASNGIIYGTTARGGSHDDGVIFGFNPSDGSFIKLFDFGGTNGYRPWGGLIELSITGISEVGNTNRIQVFPNPATTEVILNFDKATRYDVRLCNTLGEILFETTTSAGQIKIDVSAFPKGIYFVSVRDGENNLVVRKIVKM